MNKLDIASAIHQKIGGTKVQAEEVMDIVISSIYCQSNHFEN